MSVSKPILGLALGGTLGLLDGLSGLFVPSLAPEMVSVITFSTLKGLLSGIAIGYFANRVHSISYGLIAGLVIAAIFSFLVVLHAGLGLFWDIMLPGMLLGLIVGFATQKFGTRTEASSSAQRTV
jgi:hypothetical protein